MRLLSSVVLLALAWVGVHPASAQDPVFSTDTRLVVLHATVVDKKGNFITDLPQSAFSVYENKDEQKIKTFRREDIPVSMGLIIDNSGSMRDRRKKVETAALALVEASNPGDEVFIVNFNDEFFLDSPMTNDAKKLEEGLTRIDSRGGTAMRDALSLSIDYLSENGKKDKKVLLVVTDGNDNTSEVGLEKLVQKAQRSEVLIYSIGLLSAESRRERKRAERALEAITEATGGAAYFPEELDSVQSIALEVAKDIRNQYVITYSPTNPAMDGTFRHIEVRVKAKGNPKVRTRSGYYATPVAKKESSPSSSE